MARITSIKELQATCDDLYAYFVERLAQVTEIKHVNNELSKNVYLYIANKYLWIAKYNNGNFSISAEDNNCLMVGTYSDHNAIEIVRTTETINDRGFRVLEEKIYTNKNGQKTADLKKRAILLELKAKLEVLFKDYL